MTKHLINNVLNVVKSLILQTSNHYHFFCLYANFLNGLCDITKVFTR